MALAMNTVLRGRYLIRRHIDSGGFGEVYEAEDSNLHKTVAIKAILLTTPSINQQQIYQLRVAFEREARLLARLNHPSLPRVTDYFIENNIPFLVMDYIPGDNLAKQIRNRPNPFSMEEVLQWADQLLDTLHYLHTLPEIVIHRDIKPENIKIYNSRVMLLDFGLAQGIVTNILGKGTIAIGYTLEYAPLEQIQQQQTDGRSDIYGLSATLYYLLTKHPPDVSIDRLMARGAGKPDPLYQRILPNIQSSIQKVLFKGLALYPQDRYQSVYEMRAALRAITTPTYRIPPAAPAPSRHSRWLWAGIASLVVLLLCVGVVGALALNRGVSVEAAPTHIAVTASVSQGQDGSAPTTVTTSFVPECSASQGVSSRFTGQCGQPMQYPANEENSCIQGFVGAADLQPPAQDPAFIDVRIVARIASDKERSAVFDRYTNSYSLCGLSAGEWTVFIRSFDRGDKPAYIDSDEQHNHEVRVKLSGTTGEIVAVNFVTGCAHSPAVGDMFVGTCNIAIGDLQSADPNALSSCIQGQVVPYVAGASRVGARTEVVLESDVDFRRVRLDTNNQFLECGLQPATWSLYVSKIERSNTLEDVSLDERKRHTISLVVRPGSNDDYNVDFLLK